VALAALGFAVPIYLQFFVFHDSTLGLAASCTNATASGTQCGPGFLSTLVLVGYTACLFGFGLPVGFTVVRLIRKRRAWYWPLISLVLVRVGFVIITAVRGNQYRPVAGS
jgi:Na+-transporting NADH:ubiquinone oxidoreductase subunit NqrD